jgi:hypothetical protein
MKIKIKTIQMDSVNGLKELEIFLNKIGSENIIKLIINDGDDWVVARIIYHER